MDHTAARDVRAVKRPEMRKTVASQAPTPVIKPRKRAKSTPRKRRPTQTANTPAKRDQPAIARAVHKSRLVQKTCFLLSSSDESDGAKATRKSKLRRRKSLKTAKDATLSRSYPNHISRPEGYQLCALQRMFC
ncbi:hypothetical protein PC129_g16981 [Phytophthora cactorum]|uniref:Uncharacterized protein n=1 Tax=Phytophthora cactorum TaxID=29920 RepID=A0A8T1B5A7_9STRA|nr:hypothetical protein PC112_g18187 [Phytophthora cactorum]KAG2807013.1 hypothetical protein PC111_g17118 [Phytophthora cactorum]KAG2845822.1 hypothetical protein PC113_g18100 [Phytophthora cactorum]KAG2878633.1 hypothetical protein PC114_g22994 [Phytophthora cactorum]KAG2893346.1 hypothetical protein PC115_g18497 [Phytophthora cactorum]